ncbi:hypothetical protein [Streptomyces endophytica]|uniref:Gram-positive cocci surface proteins LPxTG domain-containing protein n=1 Tax=Streptomyces endophytica TaxID=2991496 RepID=A0ABY6PET2_9ACTN|nr:hypothetical protein [Streptomyces endophytica]UZJ31885.1 hypothetical protein OJ254_18375 [Streptomyces endophytica]
MTQRTAAPTVVRAVATGALATALIGLAPYAAVAAPVPAPQAPARASLTAAHDAAADPATLNTLARFFAAAAKHSGAAAVAPGAVRPHIEGTAVPVYALSPDFVRGTAHAPVARLEFLASKAVAADGRTASVWTVRQGRTWKVVNIASGDDETRYTAAGAARDAAGTVFHEPQIDAWYLQRGDRIEPLDADARKAVGAHGTTVAAYRKRVAKAYGDKLPGSAYDKRGEAGGYGPETAERAAPAAEPAARQPAQASAVPDGGLPVTAATTAAGAAALLALGLSTATALRRRRHR